MADPITFSDLKLTGRNYGTDPKLPKLSTQYDADFSGAADVTLDFTAINQGNIFGIPRTLFMDNGSNPNPVFVSVSSTGHTFTVPAYGLGYFHIEAAMSSTIRFVTAGGASDKVATEIYNWEVAPCVWYRFGVFNFDKAVKVEGPNPAGTDMDIASDGNPVYMAGKQSDGTLTPVLVDNTGAIISGGGAVFGPDAVGAAPTHPPIYIGVRNNAGNIIGLQLDAAGKLQVADSIIDDWNANDRAKVSPVPGQDGVAAGAGAIDALTQRVTIGSPTITDYSITNMTGVSQDVVTAGNGRNLVFIQALASNAGTVWFNLAGGAAVVGSGVGLAPGGTMNLQPGISNKITGIAATVNDDITVYAG